MDFICYWTKVRLRWVSIGLVSSFVAFFSQALASFHTYIYTRLVVKSEGSKLQSLANWLIISLCYKFLMPEISVKIEKSPYGAKSFCRKGPCQKISVIGMHTVSTRLPTCFHAVDLLNFRFIVLTLWQGSDLDLFFRGGGGRNGCGKMRKTLCITLRNYLAFSHI